MDNKNYLDILDRLKQLISENKSLQDMLEEYKQIVAARDKEITMLQQMLSDTNALKSQSDDKMQELEELHQYINQIKKLEENAVLQYSGMQQTGVASEDAEQAIDEMKELNDWQKTQITSLKEQVKEINNRNILLEEKANMVATLESLLADTIADRDEWRVLAVTNK